MNKFSNARWGCMYALLTFTASSDRTINLFVIWKFSGSTWNEPHWIEMFYFIIIIIARLWNELNQTNT